MFLFCRLQHKWMLLCLNFIVVSIPAMADLKKQIPFLLYVKIYKFWIRTCGQDLSKMEGKVCRRDISSFAFFQKQLGILNDRRNWHNRKVSKASFWMDFKAYSDCNFKEACAQIPKTLGGLSNAGVCDINVMHKARISAGACQYTPQKSRAEWRQRSSEPRKSKTQKSDKEITEIQFFKNVCVWNQIALNSSFCTELDSCDGVQPQRNSYSHIIQ